MMMMKGSTVVDLTEYKIRQEFVTVSTRLVSTPFEAWEDDRLPVLLCWLVVSGYEHILMASMGQSEVKGDEVWKGRSADQTVQTEGVR
jgi:hypothetical protein